MHTNLRLLPLLICISAATWPIRAALSAPVAPAPAPAVSGEDNDENKNLSPTSLKFSDPAKPGRLRLHVMWGDVTVTGTDAPEVTIVSNIKNKTVAEKRSDGLRRLDSEITYTATEKDNVITIDLAGDSSSPAANGATLAIMPRGAGSGPKRKNREAPYSCSPCRARKANS
jgi:hypothetical protein